ncbi:hypothetical protein NIES2104_47510 [Leptolyngbya sp. NIES-2104]|nr:hypothetical protein NIES2104_47510 [Leptolyngbya sp. NIES-2104]
MSKRCSDVLNQAKAIDNQETVSAKERSADLSQFQASVISLKY